jgi:hypothetical protein
MDIQYSSSSDASTSTKNAQDTTIQKYENESEEKTMLVQNAPIPQTIMASVAHQELIQPDARSDIQTNANTLPQPLHGIASHQSELVPSASQIQERYAKAMQNVWQVSSYRDQLPPGVPVATYDMAEVLRRKPFSWKNIGTTYNDYIGIVQGHGVSHTIDNIDLALSGQGMNTKVIGGSIRIPHIMPDIAATFPQELDTLLSLNPDMKQKVGNKRNIIVVSRMSVPSKAAGVSRPCVVYYHA